MTTVKIPAVATRRNGEPEPDLTSMYVIHRAMLADLRRLTALLRETTATTPALRSYTASLLLEIHHHHANEDDLVWPLLERTAGQAVDLSPFTDDHRMLAPLLDSCRGALAGTPAELRRPLADLRDLLEEHIAEEERDLFPIISRYVPAPAYSWVEKQVAKRASFKQLLFTAPWLARYATREELDGLLAGAGWPLRVLLAAARAGYARRERLVFG